MEEDLVRNMGEGYEHGYKCNKYYLPAEPVTKGVQSNPPYCVVVWEVWVVGNTVPVIRSSDELA